MGYRSDVVIAIEKEVYDKEMLLGLGRDDYFHNAARLVDDVYYWVFTGVKWYTTYPEIQYMESLLTALDDCDLASCKYGFLRIGEDAVDIDERGLPDEYDIHPHVSLEYPQSILDTPMIGERNAATAA